MDYLVGDLQGCCNALDKLLAEVQFSPSRDHLWLLGDLVNRGAQSLATLRRLMALGNAATCLLGNHDMHLLAVAAGVRKQHKGDTLREIVDSPDRDALLDWVRHRPMAAEAHGWLLVHAGVVPQWDLQQTLALSAEVGEMMRGPGLAEFLPVMYGDQPDRWRDDLQGHDRLRFIINVLTRIRFCADDGTLEFKGKDGADTAPAGFRPWFEIASRRTAAQPIAFGHWSTLGLIDRADLLALDTGCVWGGQLTAVRVDEGHRDVTQVQCESARK